MNTSKVLQNLRLDVAQLSKSCSDESISNRLLRIAMDFDAEFIRWIRAKGTSKRLPALTHPVVFETLRFMESMLESHPNGMSKPDFVKYFVGTENLKYLPTIMSMADIFKSEGSAILEPFAQILEQTSVFSSVGGDDDSTVRTTMEEIESAFRDYLSTQVNKPYGERVPTTKKDTLSKHDKKRELFFYLIDNVSEQIISVLENNGFEILADEMRLDRMFLVNHAKLKQYGLTGVDRDRSYMVLQAQDVAKTILKRIDPDDYEYNYNLLVNSAMRFNVVLSDEEFDRYFYNLMLSKGGDSFDTIKRLEFDRLDWVHPTFIEFISLTLTMVMSQVKL